MACILPPVHFTFSGITILGGSEQGGGSKCQLSVKFLPICKLSLFFSAICQLSVKFSVVSKIAIDDK